VVSVEDDGTDYQQWPLIQQECDLHAIDGSDASDKVSGSDGTGDRSLLLVVGNTFTGKVCSTTLRDLEDDGRLDVSCSF
jgi:hypothetical protein